MRVIRKSYGALFGLPSPKWLLEFGATLIGTETELVLKSRWVVPERILQEGYNYRFATVESAVNNLLNTRK
jgi:NAD dependent epimerase/dehydratase family enzyme